MIIRVLHIIGSGTIGGAEHFVYQLVNYQNSDMDLKTGILFRKSSGFYVEKIKNSNIPCFLCSKNIGLLEFIKITKHFRSFDILHFHGLYPLLFLAAIISRRKIFYYIHGARAQTKSMSEVVDKIRHGFFPTWKGVRRFIKRQWFNHFLRYHVSAVHSPSSYYIQYYISKHKVPPHKISKLPLGIDFSYLKSESLSSSIQIPLNTKVVGCVSTFRRLKRIDRLIDGLSLLLKNYINIPVCLLIVGDGEERKEIETQISLLNLADHVILTGLRSDVGAILKKMDVFVLSSEFENCPISLLEAMYMFKPVIAFKGSAGAEEIINESQAGRLVTDTEDLASTIHALLCNPDEALTLAGKAHEYVKNNYSMKVFHEAIRKHYSKYCSSS